MTRLISILAAASLATAIGCGGDDGDGPIDTDFTDDDGDGFAEVAGDCNDSNASFYPGAADPCDGLDQNCDGTPDELFDADGDGFATCTGDCRDNDPTSNPGANEVVDGFDNDCDGIADNNTDQYDDDGDGFSEDQGDCNDDPNDSGELVGPEAVEVDVNSEGEPEGVDNDCDGAIDEGVQPCMLTADPGTPLAFAYAIELCDEVVSVGWDDTLGIDDRSRGVLVDHGDVYVPQAGADFASFATGIVGDMLDPGYTTKQTGTQFTNTVPHPDPEGVIGCSSADGATVNDYSELRLTLQVPANAQAFSFDFNFMSAEFPEWVCTSFDDTFKAMLESQAFNGNVSFDAMGNPVSINVGFFDTCLVQAGYPTETASCSNEGDLEGTGYQGTIGGGTGWLTTTAPVLPGEKIVLKFVIWDEGDRSWDSEVIIDNFRWVFTPVDGPTTIDKPAPIYPHSSGDLVSE